MAGRSRKTEIENLSRDKQANLHKGNYKEVANICNFLGSLLMKDERYEDAINEHETELEMCQKTGDMLGIAIASRMIGECYCALHNFDEALEFQQRHLVLSRQLKNTVEEQRAHATIGRTFLCKAGVDEDNREVLKRAQESFNAALRLALDLKDEFKCEPQEFAAMVGRLYLNLGIISELSGKVKESLNFLLKARKTLQGHSLADDEEKCFSMLAGLYQKVGDFSISEQMANLAYSLVKKSKNKSAVADNLLLRATIAMDCQKFGEARHCLKRIVKTNVSDNDQKVKGWKLFCAMEKIQNSLQNLSEQQPDDHQKFKIYESLADDYCAVECFFSGLTYYREMLKLAERLKKPNSELAAVYVSLAQTCGDLKMYREAISYSLKETKIRTDPEELCKTWLNIADYTYHCGDDDEFTLDLYNSAIGEAEKSGNPKLLLRCLHGQLDLYRAIHDDVKKAEVQERIESLGVLDGEEVYESEENVKDWSPSLSMDISSCTDSEDDDEDVATRSRKRLGFKIRRNEKGETQLHIAVISGNLKLVKRLVEKGHPVNERDAAGWLPIHEAANHNRLEIATYLIEKNALINDMGNGKERNDLTPILDAAHSGNLEMVTLLLNHGADITCRDGHGNTVVDALFSWKKECFPNGFQKEDEVLAKTFQLLTAEVQSAMIAVGIRPENLRNQRSTLATVNVDSQPRNRRRAVESRVLEFDSLSEFDAVATTSGATEYKSAINALRSANSRKRTEASKRGSSPPRKSSKAEALIPTEEFVGDDWLQEDTISTTASRPTAAVVNLFSTSAMRETYTEQRSLAPGRTHNQTGSNEHFDDSRSETSGISGKRRRSTVDDDDEDISLSVSSSVQKPSEIYSTSHGLVVSSLSSHLRQSTSEPTGKISDSAKILYSPITVSPVRNCPSTLAPLRHYPIRRVKVRIGNFLINVPLGSDLDRSIGWLSEEAAVRYQRECENLKPTLQLRTLDDAILSASDKIRDAVDEFEEIVGVALSWNVPPIADRYVEAARALKCPIYTNLSNLLTRASGNGVLIANDMNINERMVAPISRAIQYEVNLRQIHLEANNLGDTGFALLTEALSKLPKLTTLNVSCTEITSVALHALLQTSSARKDGTEPFLPSLTELDISYNDFSDEDVDVICGIISGFSNLTSLGLVECGLSEYGINRISKEFPRLQLRFSAS